MLKGTFYKRNALICCFLFISSVFSGVEEEIGLSFTTPSGWKLNRISNNTFTMDDTTALFRARFRFIIYENIIEKAGSARDWVIYRNLAHQLNLDAHECYGVLYASDTLLQDGLFAMYANSEVGDCFIDEFYRQHYRFVAHGNFGWDIGVETDSADMTDQYSLYLGFMDSIKIKRDFTEIYLNSVSRAGPAASGPALPLFEWRPGGIVALRNPDGPQSPSEWKLSLYTLDGRRRSMALLKQFPYYFELSETSFTPAILLLEPQLRPGRSSGQLAPFIFRFP